MRKSVWSWFFPGLLALLAAFLFWPLQSGELNITWSPQRMEVKGSWLEEDLEPDSSGRPNILLIMVDDLGPADIRLYHEDGLSTPHLRQLASEGVTFEQAYVTSPVCSPSRASIITGRYAQRYGFQYQMHDRYLRNRMEYVAFRYFMSKGPWHPRWTTEVPDQASILKQGLPPHEISLSELLQRQGYHTGLVGKWHLGWSPENEPCNFGFDYQYGFYQSHSLYAHEETPGIVDQKIPEDFTDKHIWKGQRDGPYALYRNCREIEETGYLTDRIAEEGMQFMERNRDRPFFLWLSFNAPHTPLQAKQEYYDRFAHVEDPIQRIYAAMILNLDDAIGEVLGCLEELELEENTLVFFISDNGGAEYTFTTDNGPYKGGKITDFEGGVKVPFVMKWKGKLPEGRVYAPMVSSLDVFHTAAGAARLKLPADRTYDGVDLVPYLLGELDSNPHEALYWQRGFSKTLRTNRWKLFLNEDSGDTLLYDMRMDPLERENLAAAHQSLVKDLADRHAQWSRNMPAPLWPSLVYYYYDDGDQLHYFDQ